MSTKTNVSRRRTSKRPGRRSIEAWIDRFVGQSLDAPKYLAIAGALARAIEAGEIAAGERLPPQRALAQALGVDLTTVWRAYARLRALGLLEGESGRGTFVRAGGSQSGPVVDLSMNLPPPPGHLSLRDLVTRGIADVLRNGDPTALMSYRSGMGSRRDRLAAVAWLAPRLGDRVGASLEETAHERLLVAPGAQVALAALLPLLAHPGEVVLAEPLTYPGFIAAARHAGLRMAPMPCDENGPIPDAIADARPLHGARTIPKAIYVTPTLQNPTARTMSEERRVALVELARRHDIAIIEDDAYGAFLPEVTPLARLAPERVYLISTLSKCLSPGLRTAYVVAPTREAAAQAAGAIRAVGQMPTPVLSDLATLWIEDGTAHRMFEAVKAESEARMSLARTILPARARFGAGGFHLWLTLPPRWRLGDYLAAARERGVVTEGSETFAVTPAEQFGEAPGVRISLGAVPSRAQLARGLELLAALEEKPAP
jgi:DNA-binding transcriptional MocR family regulator